MMALDRTYLRADCVVFRSTRGPFGGLSNMAGGYPLVVNGLLVRSAEALYQACRYPHLPEAQKAIIGEGSPLIAKRISRRYDDRTRSDWVEKRVSVMRWTLRVKLIQNWLKFSTVLLGTRPRAIVEESRHDQFWGASPRGDVLHGRNALGRLLMELRDDLVRGRIHEDKTLPPPNIPDFLLLGESIGHVTRLDRVTADAETGAEPDQRDLLPRPHGKY